MLFVKLSEIYIDDDSTIDAGNVFVNMGEIRKLIKVRDPLGKYCSRLSFSGLESSRDLFVRETPLEIAEKCGPVRTTSIDSSDLKSFNEHKAVRAPKLPAPAPKQEAEFVTNIETPFK